MKKSRSDLLLVTIMGFPPNSDVKQALTDARVHSIVDIFTLEDDLISHLTYHDGTERVSLKLLDISKLRKLAPSMKRYVTVRTSMRSRTTSGQPTWNPETGVNIVLTPKGFGGSPKLPATMKAAATTLRDTFAKSIKKDPEAYPSFKEPGFGMHGTESFTARRICTISRMCWTTVTYLQLRRKTNYSSFRSVLCTQFS